MAILLLKLLGRIPVRAIEPLVLCLFYLAWPFTGRERRVCRRNAERVLHMTSSDAKAFTRQVLCSQTIIYLETLKYIFFPDRVRFIGKDEFYATVAASEEAGLGHVVFTGHIGAWELAGHFCAAACRKPVHVLAKPSKTAWINPILDELRQILKMKVLWIDSKSLFRDMLKILGDGAGVGFVMDQRPAKRDSGHGVTFMGVANTAIVAGPALVITKRDVPAVGAYCLRVGPGLYQLIASPVLKARHGIADQQVVTGLLAGDMETVIRQFPSQWAWNYKRWKDIVKD